MAMDPYSVLGISRDATPDEVKKAYRKKARENHPDLNPGDANAAQRMNDINEAYDRIMNPEKYAASDARANAAGRRPSSAAGQAGGSATGGSASGYSGYGYGYGGGQSQGSGGQGQGYGGASSSGPYGWSGGFGFDFDDLFGFGGYDAGPIHPEAQANDSAEVRAAINAMNAGQYSQAVAILSAITSTYRNARWYYLSSIANDGAGNQVMAFDQARRAVQMEPGNQDYQRAARKFQQTTQTYTQTQQSGGFSVGFVDPMTLCCGCCVAQSMLSYCVRLGGMGMGM